MKSLILILIGVLIGLGVPYIKRFLNKKPDYNYEEVFLKQIDEMMPDYNKMIRWQLTAKYGEEWVQKNWDVFDIKK